MTDSNVRAAPLGEHDDDRTVGRVLTRRDVLTLLGSGGVAVFLAACAPGALSSPVPTGGPAATPAPAGTSLPTGTPGPSATESPVASPAASPTGALPACIVRPEQTEGPYFVDEKLLRSDIRSDPSDGSVSEGVPLGLTFAVSRIEGGSCVPFEGALVDVWHCNAAGVYSDAVDPGFTTTGKKFLRGYQVTDANGRAAFTTIYPGWYQGRTVHIHFKIRTDAGAAAGLEFTAQLYFDDAITDQAHAVQPYAAKGQRTLRNDGDGIYRGGGEQLLLQFSGDPAAGYQAIFEIGVQVS